MIADASGRSAILEWVNGKDTEDNDGEKRKLIVTYNDKDSHIGEVEAKAKYQCVTNFIIQPNYYGDNEKKPEIILCSIQSSTAFSADTVFIKCSINILS